MQSHRFFFFKTLMEARAAAESAKRKLQEAGVDRESIEAMRGSKEKQKSERGEALRGLWDLVQDVSELDALLASSPPEAAAFVEKALSSGHLLLGNCRGALRFWSLISPDFAKKMLRDWIAHWQRWQREKEKEANKAKAEKKAEEASRPEVQTKKEAEEMPRPVKREESSYTPHPIGFYSARLRSIEERESPVSGGSPQFFFLFETDCEDSETSEPWLLGHFTSQKLTPRSKLYQMITSITDSDDQALKQGIDLDDLIGTECQIRVKHKKGNDGKLRAYIESFQPAKRPSKPSGAQPRQTNQSKQEADRPF